MALTLNLNLTLTLTVLLKDRLGGGSELVSAVQDAVIALGRDGEVALTLTLTLTLTPARRRRRGAA